MPRNKNRNRNKNYINHNHGGAIQKGYYSDGNRYNGSSGGGGNSNNSYNKNRHNGKHKFKPFIRPSILDSINDDDYINENIDRSNGDYNNTNNNSNSNRPNNAGQGSSNKESRRRRIERLKEMGVENKKLTIGELDESIKKNLLESKPHCKLNYLPDDVFQMIVNYIQNYFTCYDSNRQGLLGAYNPNCLFSLSLNMSNSVAHRSFKFDEFSAKESRNLKRVVGNDEHHNERRFKMLHQGYIDTVSVLGKLPPSEHDPRSIKLDSCYFSSNMITFALSGVFKEGKPTDNVRPLRSFTRVFVCVPDPNSQMTIVNEQYSISNITSSQFKTYFSPNPDPNKDKPQISEPIRETPQLEIPPTTNVSNEQQQLLMIQQFSAQSRLNVEWSKYCLEYAKWNYEEAANAFTQFKDKIPSDAFLN